MKGTSQGGEAPPSRFQRLLRTREAADALGISERKLWELTSRGEIPSVKIDRSRRYAPADLEDFVQKRRQGARKEEPK